MRGEPQDPDGEEMVLYLYETGRPLAETGVLFDVWSRDTGWRVSSRYWLPVIEGRGEPGPAFGPADSPEAAMPRRMPACVAPAPSE